MRVTAQTSHELVVVWKRPDSMGNRLENITVTAEPVNSTTSTKDVMCFAKWDDRISSCSLTDLPAATEFRVNAVACAPEEEGFPSVCSEATTLTTTTLVAGERIAKICLTYL